MMGLRTVSNPSVDFPAVRLTGAGRLLFNVEASELLENAEYARIYYHEQFKSLVIIPVSNAGLGQRLYRTGNHVRALGCRWLTTEHGLTYSDIDWSPVEFCPGGMLITLNINKAESLNGHGNNNGTLPHAMQKRRVLNRW